ncbi:MAG: DUF935 family protein [Candidatus Poribacteria bacterium]|nr:DUF935 family protein [Candidatus Poribacteria bacterium]
MGIWSTVKDGVVRALGDAAVKAGASALDETARPSPMLMEIGATGTEIFAGQFLEEYQSDLRGTLKYDVFGKMRADAQVAALLNVIELPIRAADFQVVPADDSEEAVEVAAFVEDALRRVEGASGILGDDFVRQAMLMVPYGVMLFEKVYCARHDGLVGWRKFAPRLPKTVARWRIDANGEFIGVEQRVFGDTPRNATIPSDKLMRFTYREEGSHLEGRSLLRDVYKYWWYKDTLYKLAAIAAERTGVGIPTLKIPRNAPEVERERAKAIVRGFRANEEAGIVMPDDFDFTLTTTRGFAFMPLIEHHNAMIAKAALAQFLNLGQTSVGSFALSQSQTDLFLMTLNGLLQHLCAVVNRQAVEELVRWNFGEAAPMPKVRGKLRSTDAKRLAETLDLLVKGNLITPDKGIEAVVRESLDLPPAGEARNEE